MVCQPDAAALVTDALASLAVRGHAPVITAANGPLLVRLGALMIDAFCTGTAAGSAEDSDG